MTASVEDLPSGFPSVTAAVTKTSQLLSLASSALRLALRLSPETSLEEVALHDRRDDCWVVLYDRVYDITDFLQEHPGGEEILLEYAGRDATFAFRAIGHESLMLAALEKYFVGNLPKDQCMYIDTS